MPTSRFDCPDGLALSGRMQDDKEPALPARGLIVEVEQDGHAALARCRDLSDAGMWLDLTGPLTLNDVVTVTLSPTAIVTGTVAWISEGECGIAFATPIDSAALRAAGTPRTAALPATLDRLRAAALNEAGRPRGQETDEHGFKPGLAVTMMTAHGHEERAVVSWAGGNVVSLARPRKPR